MEIASPGIRIGVSMFSPRPSARAREGSREARTATDFQATVIVGPIALDSDRKILHLGQVTLCRISDQIGWRPCETVEGDWMSESLRQIERSIRSSGPLGIDASRRMVSALSGAGASRLAIPDSESILLAPDALIPGDVVEHADDRRIGAILEISWIWPDGSAECRVRPQETLDEDPEDGLRWSSARVRRLPRKDPYRRYLAMAHAEDDLARRARRRNHRRSRFGEHLPEEAWEKSYWRLSNLRRKGLDGRIDYRSLGRDRWEEAANDCLDRRDRARSALWAETDRRIRAREDGRPERADSSIAENPRAPEE